MTESVAYLNGAPVTFRSSAQKMVSLPTMETELNAAVMGVQDSWFMIHEKHTEVTWTESQVTYTG